MLTRRKALTRKTPMRRMSAKRAKELREYGSRRKLFLVTRPVCQKCHGNASTDIHHTKGREHKKLNEEAYWVGLCRPCHDWIHANPYEARKRGWLV